LRLPVGAVDEVTQALRVDLLIGEPPRIADYAGTGALVAWLRVTATRRALRLLRTTKRETPLDEVLLDQLPAAGTDATRLYLRARYTSELKQAVADAFAELEVRQRNLLRQHILDHLTIDDLAQLYRVHRVTCSRWLADARTELGRSTRRRLSRALSLDLGELDTLLRFLDSDIELSVSRLLGAA
jgi:RNA polymerase sigma-70 factor (ECF subfamily)